MQKIENNFRCNLHGKFVSALPAEQDVFAGQGRFGGGRSGSFSSVIGATLAPPQPCSLDPHPRNVMRCPDVLYYNDAFDV